MNKYKAKKIEYKGIVFDSMAECDYYKHIESRIENGIITNCILQPKYELIPAFNKQRATNYVADFEITYIDGQTEVIDIKGFATETALLKAKLFRYLYKDKALIWLSKAPKYWHEDWIEYETLKRVRKERKKGRLQ